MQELYQVQSIRRLEKALIAFFVLCAISIVVVYIVDPSVYMKVLLQKTATIPASFSPVTLFLVGILGFIAVIIYGILHHWRWLFWLLVVAFSFSILDLPVTLLQFAGIVPDTYPFWYSLYRLGVALIEVGFAVWMLRVYRRNGVWAMGRSKSVV
jgi:predicted MFS family arabinose efflux permease